MSPNKTYAATLAAGIGVIAAVDLSLLGVFVGWPLYALLLLNVFGYALVVMVALVARARAVVR